MTKAERSRNLRYKKPALASMGYHEILSKLDEISDACGDIEWLVESDNETLLNALDGDEEDAYEFRMAFSILSVECEQLYEMLTDYNNNKLEEYFDICTVALIGNRFRAVGYDDFEEDYYSLTSYEEKLAYTESGKKLMRLTKVEMISTIGHCIGVLLSFQNVMYKYDYLKATFDILRDENTSILKNIKEIEKAYEKAADDKFHDWEQSTKEFDKLIKYLPDKIWIE